MRSTSLALTLTITLAAGCNARESAPAPSPVAAPTAAPAGAIAPPAQGATVTAPAAPVWVVYARIVAKQPREVAAILEDGTRPMARLSRPGVDSTFAGVLAGHRVLVAAHGPDGAITAIDQVSADGSGRREIAALPKGRYAKVLRAETDGGATVVELARADAPTVVDVVAIGAGAGPVTVGESARLVAVADGRVGFVARGGLQSARMDGGDVRALGGEDGQDRVVEARGARVLMTLHGSGAGDVRLTDLAGAHVDVGAAGVDDRAVGFAGEGHLILTRTAGGKRQLVAVGIDGKGERALTPADVDASPAAVAPSGDVLFTRADGALAVAPLAGGAMRVIDPAPGADAHVAKIVGDRAFTIGSGPTGGLLRASKLDGSATTELCNQPLWLPFFGTVTADGRAIFYRALAGRPDGGLLYSVKLDGTDLRPVGSVARDADGTDLGAPADQDFEAVTPAGRVVLEAELQGTSSHLFVSGGGADAHRISDREHARFAALTRP